MERTRGSGMDLGECRSAAPWRRRAAAGAILLELGVACAAPAFAGLSGEAGQNTPVDESLGETAKGHGSISLGYSNTLASGLIIDSHGNSIDSSDDTRIRALFLDAEYYFADDWSVRAGIPFGSNKYSGNDPHCPTNAPPACARDGEPILSPPHPESQFLDDGRYHGALQDWYVGMDWHRKFHDDYFLTAGVSYTQPSHDYTFFSNAAVGQHLRRVEVDAEIAHQFQFTNWYYRIGLGHAFVQRTLNVDVDYNRLDAELGYFVNPRLSVRAFVSGKDGHGLSVQQGGTLYGDFTGIYWYTHDKTAEHNYLGAGFGFDYRFGDKYTFSSSVQKLVWGETVFDFRYGFEARLTRSF